MSVIGPGSWRDNALRRIASIHKEMPGATADELRKALRKESGNFTGGTSWGGKVWPSACRQYLVAHFGQPAEVKQRAVEDSPLFNAADIAFPFREVSKAIPDDVTVTISPDPYGDAFKDAAQGRPRNSGERIQVMQGGEVVGTLPPGTRPHNVTSRSVMYDVRPGDFVENGIYLVANRMLGMGDLEAIPGFERKP